MRRCFWPLTSLFLLAILAGCLVPATQPAATAHAASGATPAPAEAQPAPLTTAPAVRQIRGFSMQLNNKDGTQSYLQAIDELANMGCTSINFVIAARQENTKSEAMAIDWNNLPSQKDIEKILKHAKARDVYTILMPIVLLNKAEAKEWRGVIAPPDWGTWFWHYTNYMKFTAGIAKRTKVDLLCVGSELLSTEPMRTSWIDVIAEIKKVYKGKLTYSANWDHYEVPTFWDQLDYIGMNNYNELAKTPGATVQQLNDNWKPIQKKILAFVEKQNKPFLFTEVGWHNLNNTVAEPWNYVATGDIDLNEQRRAFESFVETWRQVGTDKFMGALVWEWRLGADGAKEHGAYSLQGTPALDIVKKWMARK